MRIEDIARICHEVNRAYCQAIGDNSQPRWEDAPDWQRHSEQDGVIFTLDHPEATPEDSHKNWMREKARDGWKYGPVKNPHKKEHPLFMPFDQLPIEQRVKSHLFQAVVRTCQCDEAKF
jgi:RyR domain